MVSSHKKSWFYFNFKQFWVAQNYFLIVEKLTKINNKSAKTMSIFNFSTRWATISHNILIKVLHEVISFVFNYKKTQVGFSISSLYGTSTDNFFMQQSLKHAVSFLIRNYFLTIGNLAFKERFGIPVGIEPALF